MEALQALCRQHLDLAPQQVALVGVSGGRDSIALLHFLASCGWNELVICHLNHSLRGRESGQDAAFVRRLAAGHGLRCEVHRADVEALAKSRKLSIETCARAERDAFFQRMAQKHSTPFVFLAHHAEDQAETILGNLCRGTGTRGLVGMSPSATQRGGLTKLRPFLGLRRREIDEYVKAKGLDYREDSSNASLEYRRNRLRQEVLPLLNEVCQRDVVEVIVRSAHLTSRDEAFLRESAIRLAQDCGVGEPHEALGIIPELKAAHPALQSRVLHHWLVEVLKIKGVGSHEVECALGLLRDAEVAKCNLPGGLWLRRRAKQLFVEKAPSPAPSSRRPVRTART